MNGSEQRTANSEQRKTKAVICSLLALLCALPSAHAIPSSAGTRAGTFLNIATDARGVVLGDTAVSLARGTEAMRWNPATLALAESKEASATHIQYYQDVHIENLSGVYPLKESGVGASFFYLSPGTIEGRDESEAPIGKINFYDMYGTVAYGRHMLTNAEGLDVSLGVAMKFIQEKIAEQSFTNTAFDIGVYSSPMTNLDVGLTARNLSSNNANFARQIVGGGAYTYRKVYTGAMAINYSNDAPLRYSASGEFLIPELDNSAVRIGYTTRDSLEDSIDSQIKALQTSGVAGLTMGVGVGYKPPMLPTVKFDIDYAMAPFGALGISHTVTLKAKW